MGNEAQNAMGDSHRQSTAGVGLLIPRELREPKNE